MNNVEPKSHEHCFHPYRGVLHMVVPDGHVVRKCCKCPKMETVHRGHSWCPHPEAS